MISICRSSILIWPLKFFPIIIGLLTVPAVAQEPLLFKPLARHEQHEAITRLLTFDGRPLPAPLSIADIDLNDDGLPEALLRLPDRSVQVFAFPPRRAALNIGMIAPHRALSVQDRDDYGVRRLKGLGTADNDYAGIVYRWDPWARRYKAGE